MDVQRYTGCLLGLALGDAFGAPYEGGLVERFAWRLIGRTSGGRRRWTDDTQMTLDIAEWLLDTDGDDVDALARRFGSSYRWSRGYGPGASRILRRISRGADWREANRAMYAEGSFGNGAAMRTPALGLYYAHSLPQALAAARRSAMITHFHPLGVEGAVLITAATLCAVERRDPDSLCEMVQSVCELPEFTSRLVIARKWHRRGELPPPRQVASELGNRISAHESCVTALYLALRFLGARFTELMEFVRQVGGDVDTIGAMAGALWGARRGMGDLPDDWLAQLEDRERIEQIGLALFERAQHLGSS